MINNRVTYPFIRQAMADADNSIAGSNNAIGNNIFLSGNKEATTATDIAREQQVDPMNAKGIGGIEERGLDGEPMRETPALSDTLTTEQNNTIKSKNNSNITNGMSSLASSVGSMFTKNSDGTKKSKGQKQDAALVAVGTAGHVAADMIDNSGSAKDVANREKYAGDGDGTGVADMFGPWGSAIGGIADTGTSAMETGEGFNNYGQTSGDIYSQHSGLFDPLGNGMNSMDAYNEGDINAGEFAIESLIGTSYFSEKAAIDKTKKRQAIGDQRKKDMEAQRERLKNINNSKNAYNDVMRNANMYSGSYIARNGGTINFPVFGNRPYIASKGGFKKDATIKFKKGGSLNKGISFSKPIVSKSIIMDGALHSEFNNIGKGDKGLPIVMADGSKIYEIEKNELLLNHSDSNLLLLNKKESDEKLGEIFAEILFNNTDSKAKEFKCLNNNTCTI